MKKIIILGSNSFAGSCYVDYLLDKGYIIYGLSRSKEPSKILLKNKKNKNLKNFRFYKFDINKNLNILINILKKNKIEYVVDFLGQGMVAESWKNPAQWYTTNILSKVKLFKFLSEKTKLKKYLRISTPEAVGDINGTIFEDTKYNPSTPYGISHLTSDLTLIAYFKYNKFPIVISRFSNFYGPHQQLYRVIPKALYCIFNKKKFLLQGRGSSIRSFIYINDFCEGIYKSMIKGRAGQIYNFTNNEFFTVRDLIKKICNLTSVNFNKLIRVTKDRPSKDLIYKMSSLKAKKELKWKPKYSFKKGLQLTINWYEENKSELSKLNNIYKHKQ